MSFRFTFFLETECLYCLTFDLEFPAPLSDSTLGPFLDFPSKASLFFVTSVEELVTALFFF